MPDESELEALQREQEFMCAAKAPGTYGPGRMSRREASMELYRRTGRYSTEVLLANAVSGD